MKAKILVLLGLIAMLGSPIRVFASTAGVPSSSGVAGSMGEAGVPSSSGSAGSVGPGVPSRDEVDEMVNRFIDLGCNAHRGGYDGNSIFVETTISHVFLDPFHQSAAAHLNNGCGRLQYFKQGTEYEHFTNPTPTLTTAMVHRIPITIEFGLENIIDNGIQPYIYINNPRYLLIQPSSE